MQFANGEYPSVLILDGSYAGKFWSDDGRTCSALDVSEQFEIVAIDPCPLPQQTNFAAGMVCKIGDGATCFAVVADSAAGPGRSFVCVASDFDKVPMGDTRTQYGSLDVVQVARKIGVRAKEPSL